VNSLPSDLRHVAHHVTPSSILNSPVSDLSTCLFLKKLETHLFHCSFILSLYSPGLSQDWFIWYWPSFIVSIHTHFAIIHPNFIHANFYIIWLLLMNKQSSVCSTFLGIIVHLHFTLLFTVMCWGSFLETETKTKAALMRPRRGKARRGEARRGKAAENHAEARLRQGSQRTM